MKLPKQVKIGGYVFQFKSGSRKEFAEYRRYGNFNPVEGTITVDQSYPHTCQCDTMLHEIFHAIHHVSSCGSQLSEESVCLVFAPHLMQVLRDNPEVVKFITAK